MSVFYRVLLPVFTFTFVFNPSVLHAKQFEISAEELLNTQSDIRGTLLRGMDKPEVQKEMKRLGVKQEEVEMRLAAMTNSELQQIQQGLHRQAGGDVIVISATTLIIVLLVLLLVT